MQSSRWLIPLLLTTMLFIGTVAADDDDDFDGDGQAYIDSHIPTLEVGV